MHAFLHPSIHPSLIVIVIVIIAKERKRGSHPYEGTIYDIQDSQHPHNNNNNNLDPTLATIVPESFALEAPNKADSSTY